MLIKKDNIVIRSATIKDTNILNSWWNDGKVMAHAGFPNGLNTTLEKVEARINVNNDGLSQLCIMEVNDVRIGECHYRLHDNIANIGIKICDFPFQNKGLGTMILSMLINFLFTDNAINNSMILDKIALDTNLNNIRAQHVYEKLGFKKIRTNIDSWEDQVGQLQSFLDYELTRDDYKNVN